MTNTLMREPVLHSPAPPGPIQQLGALVRAMRPKQWTKNLLLFAGLIFSHNLDDSRRVLLASIGFLLFCALSGAIYLVNDIRDVDSDRRHPLKRNRPIASGALPLNSAWLAAAVIGLGVLAGSYAINPRFGLSATVYFILMLLYSLALKHVVILDLMVIAIGFVIRAIAGVEAIQFQGEVIPITPWFITCILFLALFIAICKRRHELVLLSTSAHQHRPVLEQYSKAFLDQLVSVTTAATVISYALYVTSSAKDSPRHSYMLWTLPFVLYGVFRYLYLVYKREEGGSPEILLLQDPSLLINVVLWLLTVTIILYR